MQKPTLSTHLVSVTLMLALCCVESQLLAQGINLTGVGPVNRAMAGAGTAAPLDAIGALHWNPGSISALPGNEVSFGMELLLADITLSTSVGGVPSTQSGEAGVAPIPSIGWVHHIEDTPMTIGLGLYGIAGFRNNLPAGPALASLGIAGPAFADAEILQIAPTLSYAVTDRLSIGISPTVTTQKVQLMPLGPSVVTPLPTPGQGSRVHWGGGLQVGVYYITDRCIHLGLTVKSPQWFEDLRFFTPGGVVKFDLDFPMIISLGAAYTGIDNWVFAVDARYFDYDNTAGYSEFGWSNIFAGAIGAQYHVNDRLFVRMGYNFNQNPIHATDVAANSLNPLIQEQNLAAGASYRFAENVDLNLAYVYLVNNGVSGPLPSPPFGPADTISNEISAHSAVVGVTVRY